jgi:hypothetical protein
MQHVMRTANDKLVSNVSGICPNFGQRKTPEPFGSGVGSIILCMYF